MQVQKRKAENCVRVQMGGDIMANVVNVTVHSNKDEVLEELNRKIGVVLEEWGLVGERYAKDKCP